MEYNTPLSPILYAKVLGSGGGFGMTEEFKQALLDAFNHVYWDDDKGPERIQRLHDALYPLDHITSVYTQSGEVYDTDSLDYLRADLVVTAFYQGGGSQVVSDYTLSGELTVGTSTITAAYGGKSATFDVAVSEGPLLPREYQRVEWVSANIQNYNLSAYIDTGFVPTVNSFMRTRFASEGVSEGRAYLGAREGNAGSDNAFCVMEYSSAGKIGFMRWGASVQCINKDTAFHDYELTPSVAKLDGVEYEMASPVQSQAVTIPIRLFGWWSGNGWLSSNSIRISRVELGNNGVTAHDYVACYRKTDNVIGFYDTVTGQFKTNEGDGTFTKGGDAE